MYKIRIILDTKEDVIRTLLFDSNVNLEDLHLNIAKVFWLQRTRNGFFLSNQFRLDSR